MFQQLLTWGAIAATDRMSNKDRRGFRNVSDLKCTKGSDIKCAASATWTTGDMKCTKDSETDAIERRRWIKLDIEVTIARAGKGSAEESGDRKCTKNSERGASERRRRREIQ